MINSLDELEAFFKLCRKQGVDEITLNNIIVKFGNVPVKAKKSTETSDEIQTDSLTPDELLFYAVRDQG